MIKDSQFDDMMFKAGSHYGGTKGNCLDMAVRLQRDICSMVRTSSTKAVMERHCCHLIGLQRRCVLGSLGQGGRECFPFFFSFFLFLAKNGL